MGQYVLTISPKKSYLNNFKLPSGFLFKLVVYIVVKNSFAVKLHADWDSLKGFSVHRRKSSGCLLKEEENHIEPKQHDMFGLIERKDKFAYKLWCSKMIWNWESFEKVVQFISLFKFLPVVKLQEPRKVFLMMLLWGTEQYMTTSYFKWDSHCRM